MNLRFLPRRLLFTIPLLGTLMIGCGEGERNGAAEFTDGTAAAPATVVAGQRPAILFLGTSLTAGYGLATEEAYPARIQEKIDSAGLPFRVINAGQSGETSAGALRRVDWLLRQPFDVLVLETGANDMLQGTSIDALRANLQAIIDQVREERPDARIVLAGMLAPPNLGRRYAEEYAAVYPDLAEENNIPLVPFLLDGVGGVPALNIADGIHPNAAGQRRVARNVWETLAPVLQQVAAE